MPNIDNRQGALRAADARREAKLETKRQEAVRAAAATILNPDEVAGDYDAKRMLMTTLGGRVRPLTNEDLRQFQHNIRQAKKKYKGGISAKQAIDLSLPEDRKRAAEEIKNALPVSSQAGVVHFQTNAGPKSDKQRHHVYVQFLNFEAAVSSPKHADKIVQELIDGKLKFDCDCGRHRFWHRFTATIGQWNYRLAEQGFPRVRNPGLHGVACKHVLRVMTMVRQSPTIKGYLTRMIDAARAKLDRKREDVAVSEVKDLAEKLKAESHRQRRVATTDEKRRERERWAKSKPVQDMKAAVSTKVKSKAVKVAAKAVEANIQKMLSMGALTKAQAATMLAAMKGVK
jgi:hypothetical protein